MRPHGRWPRPARIRLRRLPRWLFPAPCWETSINGAKGVLINVTGSMDIGLEEVETAANLVQEAAHPDANIIFGAAFDESLEDEIRVTVIATGFLTRRPTVFQLPPALLGSVPRSRLRPRRLGSQLEEGQSAASPVAEPEKPKVSDDDWDILERIFSKKR